MRRPVAWHQSERKQSAHELSSFPGVWARARPPAFGAGPRRAPVGEHSSRSPASRLTARPYGFPARSVTRHVEQLACSVSRMCSSSWAAVHVFPTPAFHMPPEWVGSVERHSACFVRKVIPVTLPEATAARCSEVARVKAGAVPPLFLFAVGRDAADAPPGVAEKRCRSSPSAGHLEGVLVRFTECTASDCLLHPFRRPLLSDVSHG